MDVPFWACTLGIAKVAKYVKSFRDNSVESHPTSPPTRKSPRDNSVTRKSPRGQFGRVSSDFSLHANLGWRSSCLALTPGHILFSKSFPEITKSWKLPAIAAVRGESGAGRRHSGVLIAKVIVVPHWDSPANPANPRGVPGTKKSSSPLFSGVASPAGYLP